MLDSVRNWPRSARPLPRSVGEECNSSFYGRFWTRCRQGTTETRERLWPAINVARSLARGALSAAFSMRPVQSHAVNRVRR